MRDSFWLDECGTAWLISGGVREIWERTEFHPNSRFYPLVLWAWALAFGKSEWALRMPSVLLMAGGMAWLAAVLRRMGGAGWPVFVFAFVSPELQFVGSDARPYAMVVFFYSAAAYALVRFEEKWQARWGVAWAAALGVAYWAHALAAMGMLAQLAWLAWRGRDRWWRLAAPFGLLTAMVLPETLRVAAAARMPAHHGFPFQWNALRVAAAFAPLSVIVPGAAALAAVWKKLGGRLNIRLVALAALTAFMPAAVTLAQSVRMDVDVMMTRYMALSWLGWFLLLGHVCGRMLDRRWRMAFVTVYAAVTLAGSLYKTGWRIPHAESDWRGAIRAAREWDAGRGRPLALQTGFVEGQFAEWLDDGRRVEFLRAPLYAYPYPGPSHVLPYAFDAERLPQIERPYVMVVYEDSEEPSKYVAAMAPDAKPVGRFLRLRVYAVEAEAR